MTEAPADCTAPQLSGRVGYRRGCRCERCHGAVLAHASIVNAKRRARRIASGEQPPPPPPPRERQPARRLPTDTWPPRP